VNTYPWKTWTIWQYTGGDMDRNVLNVDADGWHKLAKPNGVITQPQAPKPVVKPQDTPKSFVDDLHVTWYLEKGKFTVTADEGIVLRWGATTNSSKIAVLPKGSVVEYDAFAHTGGYVWIRQPRSNGYGYLPTGRSANGKRVDYWGKFE
ncbi:SH3 domain-containing protein, partial [Ligilactobacillus salivarius]|uniref:SH3 domain-containing protein n=2 Tax=Ligilactobacillus salivarius TaxID=1624 RepID=UPI001CDAB2D7